MSERARALEQALRELTAMVRGECPSLLNEDSGGNGDLSYQIEKLLAVDPPPSGASPQATGGYIHHSLTDWIPTPECDCDRCTSRHETALRYIREKETVEACGPKAPLKVEREP
jgi:hypothetical protein